MLVEEIAGRIAEHPVISTLQIQWLYRQGVPSTALYLPDFLIRGQVVLSENGRFDFPNEVEGGPEPEEAVLICAYTQALDYSDIVAWQPRRNVCATWQGRAGVLGDPLGPRLDEHRGLYVWRDVLSWLRADRHGVVILNPRIAALQLHNLGPVVAEDVEHGRELKAMFEGMLPQILVQTAQREAA